MNNEKKNCTDQSHYAHTYIHYTHTHNTHARKNRCHPLSRFTSQNKFKEKSLKKKKKLLRKYSVQSHVHAVATRRFTRLQDGYTCQVSPQNRKKGYLKGYIVYNTNHSYISRY